jgi:hypothetical protein
MSNHNLSKPLKKDLQAQMNQTQITVNQDARKLSLKLSQANLLPSGQSAEVLLSNQ